MFNGSSLMHIIPLDGKFFDDPEQAVFSLVLLNMVVLALLILALASWREGKRAAAKAARNQPKTDLTSLQSVSEPLTPRPRSSARSGVSRNKRRRRK